MTKSMRKCDNLPPLQKEIVVELAKTGPSTIHEISVKLRKHYNAVHRAWKTLKEKGLIEQVGEKRYKGKNFPLYWLTDVGVVKSIIEGAPLAVLKTALEFWPENAEDIKILHDIGEELGEEVLKKMLQFLLLFRSGKRVFALAALLEEMFGEFLVEREEFKERRKKFLNSYFNLLRKNPKYMQYAKKFLKTLQEYLKEPSV